MSLEEIKQLTADLHKKLDSKADDAQSKEAIDKIQKELDKYEAANTKVAQDFVKAQNEAKEFKEKVEALESKMLRTKPTNILEKSEEAKAFNNFLQKGMANIPETERKYLRTDNDVDGGYLAPNEYANEIIKKITEMSPIRQLVRVRQTNRGHYEFPKRTTLVSSTWIGEAIQATESNSKYGMDIISVKKLSVYSKASVEMLKDSAFNIETEITSDFTEEITRAEGYAFVNGTGPNVPEGFMTNTSITSTNSGVADAITADSIITAEAVIKTGYNVVYGMNKTTIAAIRKLKDGQGQYLWMPGLSNGNPNTINGKPYIEIPDMPDEGAGLYPVIIGDFTKGYYVIDSMNLPLIRDAFTLADYGLIRYVLMKRTGGKVVLPEAFQKIKCSV